MDDAGWFIHVLCRVYALNESRYLDLEQRHLDIFDGNSPGEKHALVLGFGADVEAFVSRVAAKAYCFKAAGVKIVKGILKKGVIVGFEPDKTSGF